jgi:hypothetical protein
VSAQPVDITNRDREPTPESVAAHLLRINAQLEELEAERARVREWLIGLLGDGKHALPGEITVSITRIRRFDEREALRVLPPEWVDRVSRMAIDRTMCERSLPPELYRACQKEGGRTVRVTS